MQVRVCVPPPQETEQALQAVQPPLIGLLVPAQTPVALQTSFVVQALLSLHEVPEQPAVSVVPGLTPAPEQNESATVTPSDRWHQTLREREQAEQTLQALVCQE